MPIHDVGYRRWEGKVSPAALRWTVIASAGIQLVWKSHWLRRMLFFSWLPAAVFGAGFFAYEQALERPEVARYVPAMINWYPEQKRSSIAFSDQPSKTSIPRLVTQAWTEDPKGARHEIWSLLLMTFFRYPQGLLMVLLVGMIAPRLISQDFRSRAFLLYFSRPLTPLEYILGKAMVIWCFLAAITTLPALALYVLGVLLSPDLSVVLYTWDLPFRILAASLVLMIPTTSLALFFSSMTTESRYAGFAWFAVWGLGWVAFAYMRAFSFGDQWSMISVYHMLGRVQEWVFGLATDMNDVTSAAALLLIISALPVIALMSRVAAPMRI